VNPLLSVDTILPKISLVTPSFNQGRYLEETIQSVLSQNYPNLEYYIIDGGSTDDSVKIIHKYASRISGWVSEPDRGQSHAINKGLARCSGDIFGWINSDDLLMPGALFEIAGVYKSNPSTIICGNVINFDNETQKEMLIIQKGLSLKGVMAIPVSNTIWHQPGIFFPMNKVRNFGWLDESLKYSFDEDLLLGVLYKTEVTYLDIPVAKFRLHPTSKTVSEFTLFLPEVDKVINKHLDQIKPHEKPYILACLEMFHARTWLMNEYFDQKKGRKTVKQAFNFYAPIIFTTFFIKMFIKSYLPVRVIRFLRKIRGYFRW
jgi:glycosyltransferase involved in cell wall biosynthesis